MNNSSDLTGRGMSAVNSIAEWLDSTDGKKKIQESLSRSEESVKILNEARTVDPKLLQEPVTL
jgi:Flp pilus assembly protein TadD